MSGFDSILTILPGYFSGEISGENRAMIDSWRKESPENEKEFGQLLKAWESFSTLQEMEQYNAFEALRKVKETIRGKENRHWLSHIQRIAAILILPILAYSGYLFISNQKLKEVFSSGLQWQTLSTPPGVKSRFFLPDSSLVYLNSSSSVTYPLVFSGKMRQIKIDGEAFVNVRKDEEHPFVVDLGKIDVQVLGTQFDVINYQRENQTEIILESGSISLYRETGRDQKFLSDLKPGQLAVFGKEKNRLEIKSVQTEKYTAWTEGKLIFRDDSMIEVVRKLNRWFNVQIDLADPEISEYIYTATFRNESIDQILELLTISAPIRYQVVQREKQGDIFSPKKIILRKRN